MEENNNIINTEEIEPVQDESLQEKPIEDETAEEQEDIVSEDGLTSEENSIEETSDDQTPVAEDNLNGKKKKKRKRKKIDEYSLENDIRYRGPLSYRGLRILSWFFLIVSQVGVLLALGAKFDAGLAAKVRTLPDILSGAKDIMMPLFLVATFATILNGSRTYKSMLMFYGGGAVALILVFILLHERYLAVPIAWALQCDKSEAILLIDVLLASSSSGFFAFNIFIDLFMVTLLTCFLVYKPKKIFVGKKQIIFRLFIIIPIGYEIACFVLKILAGFGKILLSPYFFPFLTTKPPMTFVLFVGIAIFIKIRERIYIKRGKTHAEYQAFLRTNANSWHFSRYLAIFMFIAGLIDFIIHMVLTIVILVNAVPVEGADAEAIDYAATYIAQIMTNIGIGDSYPLLLAAPIMVFFSYTRRHKKSNIDLLIPIIAILIIIFVYLEGMIIATKMVGSPEALVKKIIGS